MTPMIGDWFDNSPWPNVGGYAAPAGYPSGGSFNFSHDAKQRIVGDVMRRVSEQGGIVPDYRQGGGGLVYNPGYKPL